MAVIEKIRRRSGLLIAIIGIALLAFVLQDLFRSGGSRRRQKLIVVDKKELPLSDFENKLNKEKERLRAYYGNLTQEQEIQIDNAVLDIMVRDYVMGKEFKAVGMTVTDDELRDQFLGEEPHEYVVANFKNEKGEFDRQILEQTLQDLENAPDQYRVSWANFEDQIKENRLETKFSNLVKASYYVPKRLAEKYHENKETKVSANVVAMLYNNIPDTDVTVTEQDYKDYYEEYKYRYETDETRSIEYVKFEVTPSQLDEENTEKELNGLKEGFANAENVFNYVKNNSDVLYDSTWVGRTGVPAEVALEVDSLFFDPETEPGFVYGPYLDPKNNSYNLIRLVDRQVIEDSLMVRVAVLSKTPSASTRTEQDIRTKANKFIADNKTYDQFNAAIESEGLTKGTQKQLVAAVPAIPGLINSREIVRWAFNDAKVGDLKLFELEDMYVVAALTDIIPEGYVPLDKVKEQIKDPIMKKKKVEKCVEKMKAYGTDYARMEEELGAQSTKVELSLDSRGIGQFGQGSEVIGAIMGMKPGEVLGPVAGDQAAFIITDVEQKEPANAFDYDVVARDKNSQFNNRVQGGTEYNIDGTPYMNGGVYVALKKNAKIKDNRAKFF